MTEIILRESAVDLTELVTKFISEVIGREIEKSTQGIYPLKDVMIRKVKMLRSPKTDMGKLFELHGGNDAVAAAAAVPPVAAGKPVDRVAEEKGKKGKKAAAKEEEEDAADAGGDDAAEAE